MARPTKKQIEQREKIEAILKRDIGLYTDFEAECKRFAFEMGDDCFMAYEMGGACYLRTTENDPLEDFIDEYFKNATDQTKGTILNGFENYKPNKKYDLRVVLPVVSTAAVFSGNIEAFVNKDTVKLSECVSEFAEKNLKEFIAGGYKHIFSMPIIEHRYSGVTHKSALVNIDFTKPKEEIIALVSKIKDEFDNDHSTIQGIDEFLGVPPYQVYSCNIKECDIYKHKNPKPLQGRFADALFIYDCNKMGLTKSYAMREIDRYWNIVKNIFREKISENTYYDYLDFATKQIEKGGYQDFFNGAKQPQ